MREASGKGSKAIKSASSSPSLTTTQLKSLHYLLSAASYLPVLEGSTLSKAGLREKCYQAYHGINDDHVGVVKNFLDGTGRFEIFDNSHMVVVDPVVCLIAFLPKTGF